MGYFSVCALIVVTYLIAGYFFDKVKEDMPPENPKRGKVAHIGFWQRHRVIAGNLHGQPLGPEIERIP